MNNDPGALRQAQRSEADAAARDSSSARSKHPKDMNPQELRDLVFAMSFYALDLAQHLNFTNEWLKDEYKSEAYRRAAEMAYKISNMPYEDFTKPHPSVDIVVFGKDGLRRLGDTDEPT